MPVFPDIRFAWGLNDPIRDGVDLRESESGLVRARDCWGRVKHAWTVPLAALQPTDEQTIREFYEARIGRAEQFYFFDPWQNKKYSAQAVDETPNGVLDTFTIPGHTCTAVSVYADGVEESEANYTIGSGAGTNGEDQIVFDAGSEPLEGEVVTVGFTGRKRYLARFSGEYQSSLPDRYHRVTLSIVEEFA